MFFTLLLYAIISTVSIIAVHYIVQFFVQSLTVPKIKNLSNDYKHICTAMQQKKVKVAEHEPLHSASHNYSYDMQTDDVNDAAAAEKMKNELKQFMHTVIMQ